MNDKMKEWDKKLAEVDRAIAKLPAKAPPESTKPAPAKPDASAPAPRQVPARAPAARVSPRLRPLGVWVRVGLTAVLALALTQWPFAHACGLGLAAYLGAVGVVLVSGVGGAVSTWRLRLPKAHALALLAILGGLALVALEVLPRIGYAGTDLTWTCG
ncbi:MAG: hypothetical protein HKM89_00065 [Gemmatimonadales bacterium]|nr:hypothetical protein [Gemmatimonadales bacterium]